MSEQIRRKGHVPMPDKEPFYRLVDELMFYFVVEYCGQTKLLSKDLYEKDQP